MSKPWVDKPWPLLETPSKTQDTKSHAAIHIADDMAQVHNVLIRGINSIYLQAKQVPAGNGTDAADFLFYIHCYCDLLELHHEAEEEFLFPEITKLAGKPELFQQSIEQHHDFTDGVRRLHEYAKTTSPTEYSGVQVCSIIESFTDALQVHLKAEISDLLSLNYLDDAKLMDIFKRSEKAKKPAKSDEMFPLFFGLVDKDYEGGIHRFPAVPGFVYYLVRYWFARKHASSWRFLPCDFWGQRRELAFA
ncbi:hypothetical protein EJ05DRAFT_484781 [Pseudovirgaria hyperparasitica]|uniref:Hemerythrin-like domain-containing protein n=1 Tax=Pseudovirgaria hyperparasitica TaxID=470096 RepID=A0A6A6WBE1_9PEZI|nr:uncharacterized protein EJ05DRAFT_484781 [Pseudovirgaria hyperparasitica]KAF2759885.1 hypothetical protein EJ05DRAFT_484781 [Pseudovirgaria hyperparasitica]